MMLNFDDFLHVVPVPKHVDVIAPMDKIFAGSSLNLTCIVELFPAVDVPVSVTTTWSGPTAGGTTTVSPIHLMKVNLTNYLSWATVDEARNGTYSCKANVSSSLGFVIDSRDKSGSTTIAVSR